MQNSRQVLCEKRTYSRDFQAHHHDFGQFLFPLQGTLDLHTAGHHIALNPDYCFYLPPGHHHNYRATGRNEFLILDIPNVYLPNETESMYMKLDQQWSSIRFLLMEESRDTRTNSASLNDLTKYVSHKLELSNSPSIDYIHKHYKEKIKLEDLAKIEHYHPVYYSSWFKRKLGKTPKEYIAELRLREAKQLLSNTSSSITSISEELGFENLSSFSRWFVNVAGQSPQKFRKT
ncbi:AraC family transcriptional regulator [Cytobacillus horneckiae]|uniref:AraC family transcriptional regulator n=1 Tax=Cytobacillus horneckiae TaxID=549687 RepID=UPI00203A5F28|nr:AraC family transcriptional regulator [Cytobacillus horneckiae]MCM3180609.1 AraC family transcriptional regulator [Cytobacillus horneckiae]